MKVLQLGKVNLYRYNVEERVLYKSFGFFTTYYIENKEVFFYVASDGFKDTMADFFADDVALAERIENKELKYENIEEIVSIYNSD